MIDTAQPQVKSIENSTAYGKFEIEPLEPGFGTTLGNALRRVLLSTLKGAAAAASRICRSQGRWKRRHSAAETSSRVVTLVA